MAKYLLPQAIGFNKIKCSFLFGKRPLLLIFFLSYLILSFTANAQQPSQDESCGTMEYLNAAKLSDPFLAAREADYEKQIQQWIADNPEDENRAVVTIPVVFHIVYKNNTENISNTKCNQILAELNRDYSRTNPDAYLTPNVWQPIAANTNIQFCFAQRTPVGDSTNGIERRLTTVQQFYHTNNNIKFFSTGGLNAWNVKKYLNIWICDVDVSFAEFPTGSVSNTYGVVCRYGFLGTGKWVVTHEVGHYFNLRHIWGDDGGGCGGSDYVSDTPNQADKTSACPGSFPKVDACSPNSNGKMFMNYMDYTPGYCSGSCSGCDSRNLFTNGQKVRMNAVLNTAPYNALKTSNGCDPVVPAAPPVPTLSTATCGPKILTRVIPPSGVDFYWQGTSCGTSIANPGLTYIVNTSGTYYLRAKFTNGGWSPCSSKIVTINTIPIDPPTPTATANTCGNQVLSIAVPPVGVTFYWQGTTCGTSTDSSGLTYTAPSAGSYKIRARSTAGCWSSCDSVAVIDNPYPTPTVAGQNSVCSNSTGVVYSVINSGNIFFWSITGGTIAYGQNTDSIFADWGTGGTGIATITETNPSTNCSTTLSLNVNINSSLNPVITANSSTTFCQGDSVVLDASAGFVSYLWSNGATTQTITVSNTGIFSVDVTSDNGCSGSSLILVSVIVNSNPSVIINPSGATTFCKEDSVILTAGSAGIANYYWSNGEITQNILVSDSGSFNVKVTDTNGCSATSASIDVIVYPSQPIPYITLSNDTLTSIAATGNQWYLNGVLITGAISQNYIITENGSYSVTVTDTTFGCFASSDYISYDYVDVETIFDDQLLSIFPNPATKDLNISYNNHNTNSFLIELFSINGQLIYQEKLHHFKGNYKKEIDLQNVGKGIYFVKIITDANVIINRVIRE